MWDMDMEFVNWLDGTGIDIINDETISLMYDAWKAGRQKTKVYEPPTDDLEHPMQPIGFAKDGVIRFKENKIVKYLLDSGKINLNDISRMNFPQEDYTQLMQLIGYSVSGYGDLSTSPEDLVAKADEEADRLLKLNT